MSDQPSTPVVEHPRQGQELQDPSPLTYQMVQREVAQLRELFTANLVGLKDEITTRFNGMDKALSKAEQYPTDIDLSAARLREYVNEKFQNVEIRFDERDKRFDIRNQGNIELLSEQRKSSEQAINKAEASVAQQLEAQHRQIRDLKERMDKEEGKTAGVVAFWGVIVAVVMVAGTIIAIATTLLAQG